MFRRSTTAIDHLSSKLEFVVLQTGAKMYGCHLLHDRPSDIMTVPLKESLPRFQTPSGRPTFYHPQIDWIREYSEDKKWSWCDTRPDFIIGFVPNQNSYSLATSIGVFLALYAAIEGQGSVCPYPGSKHAWLAKSIESSSVMIARQTIHLSLIPATERGGGYNVADAKYPSSWSAKWPILCEYFGLKSAPPPDDREPTEVRTYIKEHLDDWEKLEKKHGLKPGIADSPLTFRGFEFFLLSMFDFDRQFDMTKLYATGFTEEVTTKESWWRVFDRMRTARIILGV